MKARRNRPLLLIDLSVPRNIDPAVTGLDDVALYNIDDLEAMARRGVQARERELTACHQIIDAHVTVLTEKLDAEDDKLRRVARSSPAYPRFEVTKKAANELAAAGALGVQTG
jgi:glutamyl-tRNA reductase